MVSTSFDSVQKLTIVSPHEVRVKLSDAETRQKIVSATGNDPKKYFSSDNLLVIGASMFRTQKLRSEYPTLMLKLYETLYDVHPTKVPTRAELASAIIPILTRWDKDCPDCNKPFSHELLGDKRYLKLVKKIKELQKKQLPQ